MQGDNPIPGLSKNRTVLGDLTNRRLKRGVSLILGDSAPKSGDACPKDFESSPRSVKQIGLENENLAKKKIRENDETGTKEIIFLGLKNKQFSSVSPTLSEVGVGSASSNLLDNGEKFILLEDGLCNEKYNSQTILEVGDESRDAVSTCSGSIKLDKGKAPYKFVENEAVDEGLDGQGHRSVEKDVIVDKLASRESGLLRSDGSKLLGLERCTRQMNKVCSCSFCLKAAYIWADLHYQDIKGRIAAIKKSHKEAITLVQKSSRLKEPHPCPGSSSKSKHIDVDLSSQWITLFHRMEDIFSQEGNHLQASFVKLKDVRENCKMKLAAINGIPSEKH